jgi:hypothetical protein
MGREGRAPASTKREASDGRVQPRLMELPDAGDLQIATNVPSQHLQCQFLQQPHGCYGGHGVEPVHSAPSVLPWHSPHSCRSRLHMNHSLPFPSLFLPATTQPNSRTLRLIPIHTKGSSAKKNRRYAQKKQNTTPSYHHGYTFKSPAFRQKRQASAIRQSTVYNKREARREGEGGRETQTTCSLPENQLQARNGTP